MSYVYLLSEGERGPVKVGVANDPISRMQMLPTGNPKTLRLVHSWAMFTRDEAFKVERLVLDEMAPYRLRGEWIDADEFGMKWLVAEHVDTVLFS
jgi:hypothetical protein